MTKKLTEEYSAALEAIAKLEEEAKAAGKDPNEALADLMIHPEKITEKIKENDD